MLAARQKSASRLRASSGPPRASPSASMTAFIAPAEVPEMPSITSRPSSSRWSSTPQVKAPCAPPPWSARLIFLRLWPPAGTALSGCGPTAIDREVGPGDLRGSIRAKIDRKGSNLLHRHKLLGRLGGEQDVIDHLLAGEMPRRHGVRNLPLHQGRPNVARTDAIDRDAEGRKLERHGFGQPGKAVLGGHISRLERGGDERMRRGGVDDSSPFARLHAGNDRPGRVERRRQVD